VEHRLWIAFIGSLFSACAWSAQYDVQVRVIVERGCQLVGITRDAGVDYLGLLDFGRTARLDGPSAPLSATLINPRLPRLECNPDTTYQIKIDGGQHGGTADVRYLALGAGSPLIPYRLFRDPARQIPLPVDVSVSGTVPDSGSVELPLYGRIEPLQQIPPVGLYADLLKVTLTW
jgi:spore coat protein U-like protein